MVALAIAIVLLFLLFTFLFIYFLNFPSQDRAIYSHSSPWKVATDRSGNFDSAANITHSSITVL